MPAAIVAAVISAGAGIAQSVIGAKASGKAAKQQEAAGEKALAGFAPYTTTGASAISTLGGLMGLQTAPMASTPMEGPAVPTRTAGDLARSRFKGEMSNRQESDVPRGTLRDLFQRGPATSQTASSYGQRPFRRSPIGGSGTVQMRAPTGEVQAVPVELVPFFEAEGAQRM